MNTGKKIFLGIAVIFLLLLLYASYDFSKRTTFPGRRKEGKSGVHFQQSDSLGADSIKKVEKK